MAKQLWQKQISTPRGLFVDMAVAGLLLVLVLLVLLIQLYYTGTSELSASSEKVCNGHLKTGL